MRIVKVLCVLAVLLAVATYAAAAGQVLLNAAGRDVPLPDVFQVVRRLPSSSSRSSD